MFLTIEELIARENRGARFLRGASLPPALARALGRDELSRAGGRGETAAAYPPTPGHGAAAGIGRNVAGRGQTALGGSARFELTTGVISAGLLAGIVLGFVGLYIWTRGHQA